ncbi:MAG TPA: SURF1 family protein [Gemmatimonadales bacterium]|nr:SURF1 family protein [Gemmatimonadales bacterium]
MSRGKDVAGLAVAVVIALVCVRLGVWQIARLHQRRAANAVIEARERAPVLDLTGSESLDAVQWRRVRASGVYDYARERVWTGRTFQGVPGVVLLTPLRVPGGDVWVNRGWVASPDAAQVDQSRWREGDTATVAGIAQAHEGLPYVIDDSIPAKDRAPEPTVQRWPLPVLSDGPHLSYVIQWFSFAAIILGGSLILYWKRRSEVSGMGSDGPTTI